jgi:hypothetical protein
VGGDFITDPAPGVSRAGVLAYYGTNAPGSRLTP